MPRNAGDMHELAALIKRWGVALGFQQILYEQSAGREQDAVSLADELLGDGAEQMRFAAARVPGL